MAGTTGTLLAIVGILTFFSGVFSITPRMYVFVGTALIILAFIAYSIQEFGPRR